VLEQTNDKLVIRRIGNGEHQDLPKEDVLQVETSPPESQIIEIEGFCPYLSWNCERELGRALRGRVVRVTPDGPTISLGARDGVRAGLRFDIYREGGVIRDPGTKEELGKEREKIADVEVIDVDEKFCIARPMPAQDEPSGLAADHAVLQLGPPPILVGDLAVAKNVGRALCAFPFKTDSKQAEAYAEELYARLIASLAARDVFLVERQRLREVMLELGLQQTELWDPETTARVGRQVGAKALFLGSISTRNDTFFLQFRLVDVERGQILWAAAPDFAGASLGIGVSTASAGLVAEPAVAGSAALFNGSTFEGWVQSGGQWKIEDGWLVGKDAGNSGAMITCERLLPSQFELAVAGRCTKGYLLVRLSNLRHASQTYDFAVGWTYNRDLRIWSSVITGGTNWVTKRFSCRPGTTYELKVRVGRDRSEFYIDGNQVGVVAEPTPLDSEWRLSLGNCARRDAEVSYSAVTIQVK
jgi:TolB-like protein